jgi:hypothetical protein
MFLIYSEGLNYGRNSRAITDNPRHTYASRAKSRRGPEEAETCQNAEGHKLQNT